MYRYKKAEILQDEPSALEKKLKKHARVKMDKKTIKSCFGGVKCCQNQVFRNKTVHRRYHGREMSKGKDICRGDFFTSLKAKVSSEKTFFALQQVC